jgi:predicted nucleic acid-binding protein
VDVLIACYAIVNDAAVLSVDRDFDAIARATNGRFRHQFVEVV